MHAFIEMGVGALSDADQQAVAHYCLEFLEAARHGELDDLRLIGGHSQLRTLIDFKTLVDPESATSPLMLASANGWADCMHFLLDEIRVSVDHANKSGNTALHWAALNGHAECVQLLLARGACVEAKNCFGQTPFDEALGRDQKDCCEMIARRECELMDDDEEEVEGASFVFED